MQCLDISDRLNESISLQSLLQRLPFRHPDVLIDKITTLEPNKFISALKYVSRNEPSLSTPEANSFFPNTLILESMTQVCSVLATCEQLDAEYEPKQDLLCGLEEVVFLRPVVAGDQLILKAEVQRKKPYIWRFAASAATQEYVVAEATISLRAARTPV